MNIVVIGSIAFDDVVTDHGSVNNALGGSALFFSAAASLYSPVSIVGVLGDDFPLDELDFLKRRGVDTAGIEVITGGKTFRWGGSYETDMNIRKTTNLELNVFQNFQPILNDTCRKSEFVFLGNIDPELQLSVLEQIESSRFIGADTIECYIQDKPNIFKKVLQQVNLLMINDEEARLLTGEHNIINAAHDLLKFGPDYVIIKKGEHGSILVSEEGLFIIPAYPLRSVIDPTGAGDSYAGAVMGYIARDNSIAPETIRSAVVHGGIVASFTVEDFSIDKMKNIEMTDIEQRYSYFRTVTSF